MSSGRKKQLPIRDGCHFGNNSLTQSHAGLAELGGGLAPMAAAPGSGSFK